MQSLWKMIAGALMSVVFCLPAMAQTAQDREIARTLCKDQSGSAFNICVNQQLRNFNFNCSNVHNRQQCEARNQASRQCAGLFGWEFRQCTEAMLQPDCSTVRATDREMCELNRQALGKCSGKQGEDHMNCLRAHFSGQ